MRDTGFDVVPEQRARQAGLMASTRGLPDEATRPSGGAALPERPEGMAYVSGGQGLWSTLDDYLAFARMFVGGADRDDVRLLRPETWP